MILPVRRKIILDILVHLIVAFLFSLIIYWKSASSLYAFLFMFSNILIDLDHLIDYFIFFKSKFNLHDFLNSTYLKSGRVYIFLHSWEIIFLIFSFALLVKSEAWLIIALSFSVHLLVDNFQRQNIFCYLLIYRIAKRFEVKILLPEAVIP